MSLRSLLFLLLGRQCVGGYFLLLWMGFFVKAVAEVDFISVMRLYDQFDSCSPSRISFLSLASSSYVSVTCYFLRQHQQWQQ